MLKVAILPPSTSEKENNIFKVNIGTYENWHARYLDNTQVINHVPKLEHVETCSRFPRLIPMPT